MVENIRLAFKGITTHKLRSILTMLGIIIGIAAIIAIVSTIKGTNDQIKKNLIGSGVNNVNIYLSESDWEYDFSSGIPEGITEVTEDQKSSLESLEGAETVSLFHRRSDYDGIYHLNVSLSGGYVYGVDTSYFEAAGLTVRLGRGISEGDVKNFRKVCVIDETAMETLFTDTNDPVGSTIEIKGEPFAVVGVATEKQQFEPNITTMEEYYTYSQDKSGRVYVPTSVWPLLYEYDEPESVVIRAADTNYMTNIGKQADEILNGSISSDASVKYKAEDLMQTAKNLQDLTKSTNSMLIWIAGISLLVGGIGVMNIMLVSVTERTNEIGLKKAIGAPKKAIMDQFLTEAVVLTSLGGVIGVAVGIILAELISQVNGTPVAISWSAAVIAVVFSMAIGIIFGMLPSRKAANLDPIEALRRE
jgi:putative ABC transport system permease protein